MAAVNRKINKKKKQRQLYGFLAGLLIILLCLLASSTLFTTDAAHYAALTKKEPAGGSSSITGPVISTITAPVPTAESTQRVAVDPLTTGSITQLVNKTHGLPQDYSPGDLVANDLPGIRQTYLRSEAAAALAELFAAGQAQGLDLQCCSGFRDYDTQVSVFDSEAASTGQASAEATTAPPGYSEHQTGLCIDVTSNTIGLALTTDFINTAEGAWLDANAWRYGFIIRYPNGQESITGYTYEPWHLRYLGVDVAKAVYDSGKTYEEYLNIMD